MQSHLWSRITLAWLALASLAAPAMAQLGDAPETRAGLFAVIFSVLFIVLVVVASVKNSKRGHDN